MQSIIAKPAKVINCDVDMVIIALAWGNVRLINCKRRKVDFMYLGK